MSNFAGYGVIIDHGDGSYGVALYKQESNAQTKLNALNESDGYDLQDGIVLNVYYRDVQGDN